MSYLYGASVQGIQGFIFETNKLKEIVGASQLVDNICTTEFEIFCKNKGHTVEKVNIIMAAAGNIRYVVDRSAAEQIVREFPKHIANYAPGIQLIQAVVEIKGDFIAAKKKLEIRLSQQKNIVPMPRDTGYMGLERARRTGGVAYDFDKDSKHQDIANSKKVAAWKDDKNGLFNKFKGDWVDNSRIPFDIEHITKSAENGWLAIIHADGNNLGKFVRNLTNRLNNADAQKKLAEFSTNLDNATRTAANKAFSEVIPEIKDQELYPFRPVILGGDDLTVIIRADLAFDFAKAYLVAFETETKNTIGSKLTACAGISYIKQAYPFHYGVHLAENLTKEAKTFSKGINLDAPPSSLSFYKVQASFTEELEEMQARTHFAKAANRSFKYGPYLLHAQPNKASISELEGKFEILEAVKNDKSKGISKLRNWLSELHKDNAKADFLMERMELVNNDFYTKMNLDKEKNGSPTIIKDLLELYTF